GFSYSLVKLIAMAIVQSKDLPRYLPSRTSSQHGFNSGIRHGIEYSHLDAWLRRILDSDPTIFESAYWGPGPDAVITVPRLLRLLQEINDTYSLARFLNFLASQVTIL
ncbi:hypothetical protein, partial [Xanthomonas citri]|uniref:hypothetical protein n=1 Tax=Xanthomonas citri TaxID=346 RepID=UPI001E2ED4ED